MNHPTISTRRIFVALPAYNEQEAIGILINRINATLVQQPLPFKVIVVDDGSKDKTAEIVSSFSDAEQPVQLVQHEVNQGLGTTLKTAFENSLAQASEDDIIITLDADNTHPPELMHRMIRSVEEGHDIVIASRYQPGARVLGVPFHRELLSIGAKFIFKIFFPIKGVWDYTCGFRAYKAGVLKAAMDEYGDEFVSETGFSCMADVLIKMRKQKPIVGEVPLILRYDQKGGVSKMKVIKTIMNTFGLIFRRRIGQRS